MAVAASHSRGRDFRFPSFPRRVGVAFPKRHKSDGIFSRNMGGTAVFRPIEGGRTAFFHFDTEKLLFSYYPPIAP